MKDTITMIQVTDLKAGDAIITDGRRYTVKRRIGPTRKAHNHCRIYWQEGGSSTLRKETMLEMAPKGETLCEVLTR